MQAHLSGGVLVSDWPVVNAYAVFIYLPNCEHSLFIFWAQHYYYLPLFVPYIDIVPLLQAFVSIK